MIVDAFAGMASVVFQAPFLVSGLAGSVGVLGGALALGIRHGMDWDHIAAITDITSTTASAGGEDRHERAIPRYAMSSTEHHMLATVIEGASGGSAAFGVTRPPSIPVHNPRPAVFTAQRRSLALGSVYALGHGSMVVVLGLLAILFSEILPAWIDPIMERVVGVTLVFLGCYLLFSLFRFYRHGGEFRIRSRWMLVFSGVKSGWRRLRSAISPAHDHPHHHPADEAQQYGVATSYGIGLIHGVGAETGTQVLVIGTAVGAASTGMSIATLFVFVAGLLISNSFITVVTAAGFVSAGRRQEIYLVVGGVAAIFSLALGFLFLTESGALLPDLDPYFRWVGGPA